MQLLRGDNCLHSPQTGDVDIYTVITTDETDVNRGSRPRGDGRADCHPLHFLSHRPALLPPSSTHTQRPPSTSCPPSEKLDLRCEENHQFPTEKLPPRTKNWRCDRLLYSKVQYSTWSSREDVFHICKKWKSEMSLLTKRLKKQQNLHWNITAHHRHKFDFFK